MSTNLTDDLLSILRCPLTRSPLRREGDELVAAVPEDAPLRYPIRDDIPILLLDEATLPDNVATLDEFRTKYADLIPA
jgi:uncharacterized protein YbaR (Trm112 family)